MSASSRRSRPSWRTPEGRALHPEWWLFAAMLVGILLVEVWQSAHMAQLCFELDRTRAATNRVRARLEFQRADLERRTTRAQLAPVAMELGLAPADARQVVVLPSEYLADARTPAGGGTPASLVAWAEGAARALVPEARARGRMDD